MEGYGPSPLREAIAARYGVSPANVLVTAGATHALFLLGGCLIEPGDRVAVETPGYQAIRHLPTLFGAHPIPLERPLENRFRPDPARAEALFRIGVRLLLLSDLHNPSGVGLLPEEIRQIAEAAERHGARLLVDEIYAEFLPREKRPAAFRLHPAAITVTGATKAFGFGGVRIGWALAEEELVRRAYAFNDYVTVLIPSPSARLALRLLRGIVPIEERLRAAVAARRAVFEAWLAEEKRVACVPPDGGIVAFPRLPEGMNGARFAKDLAERERVRVVPGEFFGAERHVRIGFGEEPERVREGLRRFSAVLDAPGR
jgi:aspartate/methionine/tyrosine aminotransferase